MQGLVSLALFLGGRRLSGATSWAVFASLARHRRKKILMLLKRNLEGPRVHSYVAACTARRSPRTAYCIFLNLGLFCCFDSSTTVSEQQHVCKLVLAMEYYCNEGSW